MAVPHQKLSASDQDYIAVIEAENEELRERIKQLEQQIGMVVNVPLMMDVTASEAKVLGVLMERELATKEVIMLALYSTRGGDDEAEIKIVDVFICKVRKKIKKWGIEIKTSWGRGYYMEAESKAKMRSYLPKP